jgi:hypothetical protein
MGRMADNRPIVMTHNNKEPRGLQKPCIKNEEISDILAQI